MRKKRKIVYVDMDGVIVDFESATLKVTKKEFKESGKKYSRVRGIYAKMKPIEGAIDAVYELMKKYDVYILSAPSWENDTSWSDKNLWIRKYFADDLKKRLILTHYKNLNKGDYLIDDMKWNGADEFEGEHIHFGVDKKFKNWNDVLKYLM